MIPGSTQVGFEATLLRPAKQDAEVSWLFVILPREISEKLPRRGKTTVTGRIHTCPFQATLDPDGQLSHWLKIDKKLQIKAGLKAGDRVFLEITPLQEEPEPEVPEDFLKALQLNSKALNVWNETTTVARLDWVHWITSAKQEKTRLKRIQDASEMLAAGKKRVCCFDPSGFYSKVFRAPEAAQ
ncbi:MAG: DUF1905 domain-containing protein [Blastochloris sp.]|nr:DUF1905 domain-containing protein [Blastochloris sp.]